MPGAEVVTGALLININYTDPGARLTRGEFEEISPRGNTIAILRGDTATLREAAHENL
jgi:hypothetical protein